MSTHKYIDRICVAVLALSLLLTILFMNGASFGIEAVVDEDSEAYTGSELFTANDRNGAWDTSEAVKITLQGTDGEIAGPGAYFLDGNLVIASAGYYVVSGELTDGSIVVDAHKSSKVWIMLDGVELTCSDDACIRIDEADKVFLTLADGSENVLESGAEYSDTALADGTDGAIFSHEDLTINGSGSLTVTAGYKHGIACNDDLVIAGGILTVTAAEDGINVNDSIRITDAEIQVAAKDDGIHSDTEIDIVSGTILIEECYEGIEAPQINISGGEITIYPSDDGLNANGGSDSFGFFGGGRENLLGSTNSGETENTSSASDTEDSEDEELPCIRISGGTLTIMNENGMDADGIDSNGDIIITGGTIRISLNNTGGNNAIDYGSESGGSCVINGGTVIACGSSSMAEEISSESEQCSILYILQEAAENGETLFVKDSDGNVLLEQEIPYSFSCVILSSSQLQLGQTYELAVGSMSEEITLEEMASTLGNLSGGMFGGGMMGGFSGMGNMPQMGGRPDMESMSETGEFPDMENMPQMGERPDMESMSETGEFSNMENMPQMGGRPDMESMSETGEFPDMENMPQTGERPDMENMSETGEFPDMENMPQMGERPDMESMSETGEFPDMENMPQTGGRSGMNENRFSGMETEEETETYTGQVSVSELSTDTWIWLGISVAVLFLGIGAAAGYRRR